MSWSPVTVVSQMVQDLSAPGAPQFHLIEQVNNNEFAAVVVLPTADANGSGLSGLAHLRVASASRSDGSNPFEGIGPDLWPQVSGVQIVNVIITPEDAGDTRVLPFAAGPAGSEQWFAAACNDTMVE
jgi:hypothetical protein